MSNAIPHRDRDRDRAPVTPSLPSYLNSDPRRRPDPATRELAQGLGWFSIGLGLTEVTFGGAIARWLGMPRAAPVIQVYGVRELIQGAGILGSRDPTPWISARVAGDALDIATVLPGLEGQNPRKDNVLIALVALVGVTAIDVICAQNLSGAPLNPSQKIRQDYRRRSGFRRPAKAASLFRRSRIYQKHGSGEFKFHAKNARIETQLDIRTAILYALRA